nr:PREDICTED: uncharacterized protein LOC109040559 [Bemisia tabaci]
MVHEIELGTPNVVTALSRLITSLYKKSDNKTVVILIDEYDSPYTESFTVNEELANQVLGLLRSFFKTLKTEVAKIRFCFTTGITRLSLSDFFSGANSAVDLTMDPEYSGIVGFTRDELTQYFGGFIEKVAAGRESSKQNILKEMSIWHYGFRFTAKNESLFSPISVIGYLRSGGDVHCYSDTGGASRFLIQRLKTFKQEALRLFLGSSVSEESDECDEEQKITAKREELTGKINYDDSTEPEALKTLLFHSGYLSVGDYNNETQSFTLKFSNLELRRDYAKRFYHSCTGDSPTKMERRINSLVKDLDLSRWESFISKLDSFHSSIPYYLNVNQRKGLEAWFQFTMYLASQFSTYKNVGNPLMADATNKGRADITLHMNNKMYIFEPKMMANPENAVYECKVNFVYIGRSLSLGAISPDSN